ncbi:MAG: CehA/McbA family metallohydrolase [Myxococcota bacterium]
MAGRKRPRKKLRCRAGFVHAVALALGLAGLAGCGDSERAPAAAPGETAADAEAAPATRFDRGLGLSPDAQVESFELIRNDQLEPRHPSDGGGLARLLTPEAPSGTPRLLAGTAHHFAIEYEAGPLGIAEGGALYLQPSPFWGWDPPQSRFPDGPGYARFSTDAEGIELETFNVGTDLVAARIGGRPLKAGERILVEYGAGAAGARVDRFAERGSKIWLAVDGDGDGVRKVIEAPPSIEVLPGPAARLVLSGPSTAEPGETVDFTIAVVDVLGNAGVTFEGTVSLAASRPGLSLPKSVRFDATSRGRARVTARVEKPGLYRVRAATEAGRQPLLAESNPLIVRSGVARQFWGDLHGHSNLSDGSGTPSDYYDYARDIAGLDFAALTDHDHWGMRFLDDHPEMWEAIRKATHAAHDPGDFVSILGFEWTSWLHGHRHVLYFADDGPILSSMDPDIQTPTELWSALRGQPALTFAHHSAGGPVATNWNYAPDPEFEPVTEIVSIHGSSEAPDSPGRIYKPVFGNFVREILVEKGFTLGFIGSGDSHDGHPGLAQLSTPSGEGGLAAVLAESNTREAIAEAIRARRVYATNGPRIFLRVHLDGEPMGSVLRADPSADATPSQYLEIRVAGEGPLRQVDVIRGADIVESFILEGEREWSHAADIPRLEVGEHLYVRALQEDGGTAWSSPLFAR